MKVLVINSGSSSLKYQLLDMNDNSVLCSGIVERIGDSIGKVSFKKLPDTDAEAKIAKDVPVPDHKTGMHMVVDLITDAENGVVKNASEIDAVGHRVLHCGEKYSEPILVDADVKQTIEDVAPLGPLHNMANLTGILVAEELFPHAPQVAVFDTAFHQTMPKHAFMYALPYELYEELRIRRYGFHGTSHRYVAKVCEGLLDKPAAEQNIITAHLGNGCSLCAVQGGKCIDTSMGLTPLAGVIMGTRCGDIDPAILAFLAENKNMDIKEIDELLNKQSGLKGVCGVNDMRDIHERRANGDEKAQLAFEMMCYSIKKYIGSYMAALGRTDALVFTAGIGENDDMTRAKICEGLEHLGVKLDPEKNLPRIGTVTDISAADSAVRVWVIPTNEELSIAQQTVEVLNA